MGLTAQHNQTGFAVGDLVRLQQRFFAGDKAQQQAFDGVVIAIKGRNEGRSITVRKIAAAGIGVEKIWPLAAPNLLKVTVKKAGRVSRGKLYYLRQRIGRQALATKTGP